MYKFLIFTLCYFSIFSLTDASENVQIVSSTNSSLTLQVGVQQGKLQSFQSENNDISYYQSFVLAVPSDGNVSLASLELGSLKPFKNSIQTNSLKQHSTPVEFSKPMFVRGQKYVTVYLFPVTPDGCYENMQVSFTFDGTVLTNKSSTNSSPFDKMLSASVVNYEQSKQFQKKQSQKATSTSQSGPFDSSTEWIKIAVNRNGLYKVTGAQLDASGMIITGQTIASLHLYNSGGKELSVPNELDRPVFEEVALKIVDINSDGIIDANDYILFYGESVNRWEYDTTEVQYLSHSYTEENVYWLNSSILTNGLRMVSENASIDGVVGGTFSQTLNTYTRRLHVEQNNILQKRNDNKTVDYFNWFWSNESELSLFVSTENIVANDEVEVVLDGITGDTTGSGDNIQAIDFYVNNVKGFNASCVPHGGCTYSSTSFIDGSNSIDLDLMYYSIAPPFFNYIEIAYEAYNQPIQNILDLPFGQISGASEIEVINNFVSEPMILDISNPLQPRELLISSVGSADFSFYDTLSATKFNRYFLTPESQSLTPLRMTAIETIDLYTSANQTDLIIISPEFLQASLTDYIDYRQSTGYSIKSVSVEEIMNNFGFGLYDPTAIRDFLKNSYETYPDPKPSAVLFVGDGNYDYLNNLSTNMPNFAPPYIYASDNTSSDDNYVYFGEFGILDADTTYDTLQTPIDRGFDMMTARWPVRTTSDVRSITDKIKSYEATSNFGNWRNNITLVADDEFGSQIYEYFHTEQIENLEKNHLPILYNREKIYLWEYPVLNGEKPDVNQDIISSINNGTLLVNYVGHGNPDVWAHENVFNRTGDLPQLDNNSKLSLFVAASCAIGFFDDPLREGMAEELLSMSNSGAIGVISATRIVYSSDNSAFNRKLFDVLFKDNLLTMCEAVYTAKLERQYIGPIPSPQTNDRNYLYFGGPFVKLAKPQYNIEFLTQPDSLVALGQTRVTGRVLDENGTQIFENGTIDINVLDSKRNKSYHLENRSPGSDEFYYSVNGPTIFRGTATVTNGEFDFQFVPPLDIGFGGDGAQISVYAAFESVDAAGIIDSIVISDSIANSGDSLGPEIKITFSDHLNFNSGDVINKGESLLLDISDQSGINLAGGLGHGITLEIDNQPDKIQNLNSYFSYNQDSFTQGSLEFPINDLDDGVHSFKVKVWDNANNFGKVEFDVDILENRSLQIVNLLNYPNPMRESTRFSFNLTQPVENFVLDIYTLSGKKIKTFNRQHLEASYFDDIVWYGNDVDGDRVATEVYIFKATAYPSNGGDKVESFGKIILVN